MKNNKLLRELDLNLMILPFFIVLTLCSVFIIFPEGSANIINTIRQFLGNDLGSFYIVIGFSSFMVTLYIAFSKFGQIKLGNLSKPKYSDFKWATMIFTGIFAADIIYYSFIEWALYANESYIQEAGVQEWAPVYPLFHWGPIPWSFYIALAISFGFMIHVRKRKKQKFSEACRPILKDKVDKLPGKAIDLLAICALLAGTATTFSLATPLLASSVTRVFGIPSSTFLTIAILIIIALVYGYSVLKGIDGIIHSAKLCTTLFIGLMIYVLFIGGETMYIIETGITSLGTLAQNFISLSTSLDPLRVTGSESGGFVQNWTVFYWAYWLAWCVATPFFIGIISEGRTIKNVILGSYIYGIAGTFSSFIIFGNYGLSQQLNGNIDILSLVSGGKDLNLGIIQIFETLPFTEILLIILFVMMVTFYSTTFESVTMVVSIYSYKNLEPGKDADNRVKTFWTIVFIILPIGLIFSENSIYNLQSVSIIAAFPIGIIFVLIIASFFKDANSYILENSIKENEKISS